MRRHEFFVEVHVDQAFVDLRHTVLQTSADAQLVFLDRQDQARQNLARDRHVVELAQRAHRRCDNRARTGQPDLTRDARRIPQREVLRREFDSLVTAHAVPRFNSLRFINDHTEGLRINRPTPFAHVADNDLAVGLFVEHLSNSPIWKESIVFIVEDDAQNGPDHVDAHRTIAFVAGPYVKRGFVDHTMYSTSSMLRTMELILGLPPMSQYDAAATPMWRSFTATPNFAPFASLPANVDLNEKNVKTTASAKLSETFDFSKEDLIPDLLFSEVIWKAVKGEDSKMPAPRRSAFVRIVAEDEKDTSKQKKK